MASILLIVMGGLLINITETVIVVVAILSFLYFVDVLFNLYLVLKSLYEPPELTVTAGQLQALQPESLPMYTILCPLYKEAHILPQYIEAIDHLDYPKDKLDVMLLLEDDDTHTIDVAPENESAFIYPYSCRTALSAQNKTQSLQLRIGLCQR